MIKIKEWATQGKNVVISFEFDLNEEVYVKSTSISFNVFSKMTEEQLKQRIRNRAEHHRAQLQRPMIEAKISPLIDKEIENIPE
jgi:guanylate kinase